MIKPRTLAINYIRGAQRNMNYSDCGALWARSLNPESLLSVQPPHYHRGIKFQIHFIRGLNLQTPQGEFMMHYDACTVLIYQGHLGVVLKLWSYTRDTSQHLCRMFKCSPPANKFSCGKYFRFYVIWCRSAFPHDEERMSRKVSAQNLSYCHIKHKVMFT